MSARAGGPRLEGRREDCRQSDRRGAAVGAGAVAAAGHQSGCHGAHSCPSDHHTYVWYDGGGQGWSCPEPGAPEHDPSLDTTVITYAGLSYYCRAVGSPPPPLPPPSSYTPPPPTTTAPLELKAGSCGKERWAVKTLSDGPANSVNFTPKGTSVAALRRLKVRATLRPVRLAGGRTQVACRSGGVRCCDFLLRVLPRRKGDSAR
jgi:hypothetical protein